ncbi:MAG: LPS export ABC transporter periplasmic protein LptC [Sphingobacteriia bacterium]|nr:LPS export ABC transporter periplasmic protein LptC [Sphingobacteriia bacterium]NCC38046.1 LPS export ABC transporter periplasmic protein LptC [Gammaproteobacteria bacterium]
MSGRARLAEWARGSAQTWWLAAFFLVSGLLAWWRLAPVPEPAQPPIERSRLPDYVVKRFTAVETDDSGQPLRQLIADELRQFVEEDLAELDQPRMTLYSETGEPWRGRADHGLVLDGGSEVRLLGEVELERAADAAQRATLITTELLRIWHLAGLAETDQSVRIASGADWLTASGMRLWYTDPMRAHFDGRARLFIAPTPIEAP